MRQFFVDFAPEGVGDFFAEFGAPFEHFDVDADGVFVWILSLWLDKIVCMRISRLTLCRPSAWSFGWNLVVLWRFFIMLLESPFLRASIARSKYFFDAGICVSPAPLMPISVHIMSSVSEVLLRTSGASMT